MQENTNIYDISEFSMYLQLQSKRYDNPIYDRA